MEKGEGDVEKGKAVNEDFENDLEANASAFEALERDFQDVCFIPNVLSLIILFRCCLS